MQSKLNSRNIVMVCLLISIIFIVGYVSRTPPVQNTSTLFSGDTKVSVIGYSDNAMEPSISRDGSFLFFNSLNDGENTSIFYATRIDDKTFQFMGLVNGVNTAPPHLDAVSSMDVDNNFYFISTRNYPGDFRNVFTGTFSNGAVINLHPVDGDFYIEEAGWIIMDAEISPDGSLLFFVNARFEGSLTPAEAHMGVAHKTSSGYLKDQNSDVLLKSVNDMGIVYAPSFSANGLEIYFTQLKDEATHIFVSRRASLTEPFGQPELIDIKGTTPEAPSISIDGEFLYYHKLDSGKYAIFRLQRNS